MAKAIQIDETGGPEVLRWREVETPAPGPGQIRVAVAAAGVNYIDTYHRSGLYPLELPSGIGLEGAGAIDAVGEGVAWKPGTSVAWARALGSYATHVIVAAEAAVEVPAELDLTTAAAVMIQGLTAHYLVTDTFALAAGHRCLIHAGAGGVGLLLVQMAKRAGAEVFTTVGSDDKAALVEAAGADHVIRYREVDFVEAVDDIAGDRPLDVVFDGVGKTTFEGGLALLRPRGTMVTFGNASGPVEPVSPLVLSQNGSLFLTRPTLGDYTRTRDELVRRTDDLFAWIGDGMSVRVDRILPLEQAAEAHQLLEGRATKGKLLLVP